jgi:molybdopterin molybdotransferase
VTAVSGSERLLAIEEALARVLAGVHPLPAETATLGAAAGRILASDVVAHLTLPPWDNASMDGFAVRAADVADAASPDGVVLRVVGEVAAGSSRSDVLVPGTAVRIATGAPVPPGADAVVPVEDTDASAGEGSLPERVVIHAAVGLGSSIRRAGSNVRDGDRVLTAGARIGPAALGVLAALGHASVDVRRRPRVAILSTGNELVPVGRALGPAQIHDSNSVSLAAQATLAGAEVRTLGVARDDVDEVIASLRGGIEWADIVIVSGGASVGAHDVVRSAFSTVGSVDVWRVAARPGKPFIFGRARHAEKAGDVALFGLPGNPVSVFVTFELFVRPLLRALSGRADPTWRPSRRARLLDALPGAGGRRTFVRVVLEPDPLHPGSLTARPSGGQDSHVLSALAAANGLAIVPEDSTGISAGAEIEAWQIDEEAG